MKYEIEWYNPKLGTPTVSLAEYGLVFNKAATEALRNPGKIRLGFDKKNLLIAVVPTDKDDPTGLKFLGKERRGFTRINSKDFIRFIIRYIPDFKIGKAVRFLARFDEEEGILIVDLKQPLDMDKDIPEQENEE